MQKQGKGGDKSASVDDEKTEHDYPSGLPLYLILTSVTLAYFLFFLDLAVISTATPAITSNFDSLVDVGWYGGAYQLGSAAFQPLTGKIYSQFSTKACLDSPRSRLPSKMNSWTFLAFFFIFEVGSAICGAAQTSSMFIVGRVVAGVGSAGVGNGALTTISSVLPLSRQSLFMGLNMGMGQLGLATGPIIGGAFTSNASWRWCASCHILPCKEEPRANFSLLGFYVNLPLGVIVGGFLLFNNIPEPKPKRPALEVLGTAVKSLDLPGFFLICPTAVMFLLGLQYGGNEYEWDSSVVIGLLVGAAVTFVLFLLWERRQGDEAMVPFAMLKHRVIWSAAMTIFFSLSSVLVADFYVAIYFQAIRDDSPLMSGVHMLPITLGLVMFTVVSGVLISLLGYYLPFLVAGACISAISYGLLSQLSTTTSVAAWIGYQILYGVGSGCTTAAPYIAKQNLVPAKQIPQVMGIIIFTQNIGAATSLVAANTIFSNSLRTQLLQRADQIGHSPEAIVSVGVRSIRSLVSDSQLEAVLAAYSKSIDHVMYLGLGVSIAVLFFAWGLGWKDIRKVKELNAITDKSSGI
ncbi:hypothetical protein QQS21_000706 [Conoideocrella luteorostrata]|uniref:Major facilitator superfamily (MFS) profile domain-containing protein n=1 Tax=Conoideocrella luteorostrata TaxID=1105319 RepID=A0AAJ0D0N1_9HYPO|nr:hypothetical protein QQS21_000706 [Conoideocrella luteorostrata]